MILEDKYLLHVEKFDGNIKCSEVRKAHALISKSNVPMVGLTDEQKMRSSSEVAFPGAHTEFEDRT